MRVVHLPLEGLHAIEIEKLSDARGFFARTYCRDTFAAHGLQSDFVQSSVSYNSEKGTLRGMHFQAPPHGEAKVVRCTRGAIFDVAIDLRPDSPTYARWHGVELTESNRTSLYIPAYFAHGFLTLEPATEVTYMMTEPYRAESAAGVRWNDPAFAIAWPFSPSVVSDRDQSYADLQN